MKLEIKHLAGYLPYELKYKDIEIRTLYIETISWCLAKGKPILRPLSDLTEEYVSPYILEKIKNCSSKDIRQCLSYKEMDCLLEMHFDIYGLIENNSAIDINTLTK